MYTTSRSNMATCIELLRDSSSIKERLFEKLRQAEDYRKKEYDSAVKIQSWFRGIKVRAYLKFLHYCATVIQKQYKGHLDRALYRKKVQESVILMREKFYYAMAVKIQKSWRGFYTRKYVHNYYSRKKYLEGLQVKNAIVRKELEVWRISLERENEIQKQKEEQAQRESYTRRHHYLISTAQVPGIYNSHFHPEHSWKEMELRSARQRGHYKNEKRNFTSAASRSGQTVKTLPPIGKAAQGPFRKQDEVSYQRHRPLNPTLRVQTSYTSVEERRTKIKADEWVARVVEKPFQPFTRRDKPYNPLIHTKSNFGSIPYGTKHFRDDEYKKHINQERFQTVASPIPVFEQFGKTY